MNVSMTRNATMYSLTRFCTECHEPTMTTTVSRVESSTNQSEMPSTPMW